MIKEKIRYTKTGKRIELYEFKAKLHQKVVMSKNQFEEHIFPKHPEISLEIIKEILENPDFVTKQSKSRKEHFYQKKNWKAKLFCSNFAAQKCKKSQICSDSLYGKRFKFFKRKKYTL